MPQNDTAAVLAAIERIKARAEAAHDELGRICANGARFTMSVPVRPDDFDIMAGDAFSSVPLLVAVARAAAEWSAATAEYNVLGDQEGHFTAEQECALYNAMRDAQARTDAALAALATGAGERAE